MYTEKILWKMNFKSNLVDCAFQLMAIRPCKLLIHKVSSQPMCLALLQAAVPVFQIHKIYNVFTVDTEKR